MLFDGLKITQKEAQPMKLPGGCKAAVTRAVAN